MIGKLCLLAVLFGGFDDDEFTKLEQDVAPEVSYAINEKEISIRVENPYDGKVSGRLAMGRSKLKTYNLIKFPATIKYGKAELGKGDLRVGFEITWLAKDGTLRDRRVYLSQPEKGELPTGLERLAKFDVKTHMQNFADSKSGAFIPFTMKKDGYATIAIEDEKGNRIRNLVNIQPFSAGKHRVEWDGRNEFGQVVAPGIYRYRALQHPGLTYDYRMQFANGDEDMIMPWGSNHSVMSDLCANDKYVFAASHITEGGNMLVALTPEGKLAKAYPQAHPWGGTFVRIAADDKTLYLALQGNGFAKQPDNRHRIAIVAYDIETTQFKNINRERSNFIYVLDQDPSELWKLPKEEQKILRAIEVFNGKLYVANAWNNELTVLNPENMQVETRLAIKRPMDIACENGKLYVGSEDSIYELNSDGKTFKKLFSVPFKVDTFSVKNNEFAILGDKDSTIKFYSYDGKSRGAMGEPGGVYAGEWREKRLVNPVDVQFDLEGKIWTTEFRRNPKRIVRWSREGEVLYTKYGCPAYGSSSCGFDPDDPTKIYAEGVEWKIDYANKKVTPVAVQIGKGWMTDNNYHLPTQVQVTRVDGRTFVIWNGCAINLVMERQKDGALKPMMMISNVQRAEHLINIPGFAAFVKKNIPENHQRHLDAKAKWARWSNYSRGFVWLDKNNNGEPEEEEFTLIPGDIFHSVWGMHSMNLTFNFEYRITGYKDMFLCLSPDGFLPNGVLNYDVEKALANSSSVQFDFPPGQRGVGPSTCWNDANGNMIYNTDPWMMCITPDGKLNWIHKNPYADVHGSHKAPPPRRGLLQAGLFSFGVVPFDKESEIFALHSNAGQVYFFTTDGLMVDQLFEDQRSYSVIDYNLLGEEAFGGALQYIRPTKEYLLQAGGGGYRIYQIKGIENVKRFSGEINLTHEMLEATLRRNPEKVEAVAKDMCTTIPKVAKVETIGRNRNLVLFADWEFGIYKNQIWGAYDDNHLVLQWNIQDDSPWKNNGKDWTMLFKSGDSVDFQICLDDKLTNEKDRREAKPGDMRLLIAPFKDKNMAVLYRFKVKGKKEGLNSIGFSSPWRTYNVDDVKEITNIEISREGNFNAGYRIVAKIPLSELGVTAKDLAGKKFRGDFGVVYSDRDGNQNLSRTYWANKETGLVSDVPGEIMPPMHNWGTIEFGK